MIARSPLAARLRPGLDVNDGTWAIVRGRAAWQAGTSSAVGYDAGRGALELAPLPRPELGVDWLPLQPVAAPDGSWYRSDPSRDLLLVRKPCDETFAPVEGLGGHGFASGSFHLPLGVAVDGRGRVYVADAGNGRVQVILPESGEVEAVLGEALIHPVHVAIGSDGTIFVADAGTGRVHSFSGGFAPLASFPPSTLDPWSDEPWTAPPAPRLLAIGALDDDSLVLFDPQRPGLWHMTADGDPLPALPWPASDALPPGWAAAPARFAAEGEMVVGPIDGGTYNFAWHRVMIDARLPAGSSVSVQTYASNETAPGPKNWAPRRPVAAPHAATDPEGAEYDRLVLRDTAAWERWNAGILDRVQPELHRFEGDGPVATDSFILPAAAARRLQIGDRIVFTTAAGGRREAEIVDAAARTLPVMATGAASLFAAPESLRLLERDGRPLAYGPVDLAFLIPDPAALALGGLNRSGHPEDALLPHALAAFLEEGDVVGVGEGRMAVVEREADVVLFRTGAPLDGDFATSLLTLLDSAGRLLVRQQLPDAAELPEGSEAIVTDDVHGEPFRAAWVDAPGGTIWLAPGAFAGEITPGSWLTARFTEPKASDKGRYLWVRLVLRGPPAPAPEPRSATATPSIRALRLTGPRPSLLEWLPAIFSRRDPEEEAPGANFLERFLTLFEGELTRIETAYESVSRLLNPAAADAEWLDFVASWLDLAFDPSWPIERRRMLVLEGARLQAGRGTPAALARYLEIYTGSRPAISEGFANRSPPPIQLGARGALGVAPLGGGETGADGLAHRFAVSVTLPAAQPRQAARSVVRKIVETMKPAHTAFTLDMGRGGDGRIGIDGIVGAIVIPGAESADPCACDPDSDAPGVQRGHVPAGFRLGGRLGRGGAIEMSLGGG